MVHKTVMLWSPPRSVSSAFERSIRTLSRTKLITEVFSPPYYHGPERRSKRYKDNPVDPEKTYRNAVKTLLQDYDGIDLVFSKNMAYSLEPNPEFLLQDMKDIKHSFLIRDPSKSIYSLYKLSTSPEDPDGTGWDYFDPEEVGFRQLYEMYNVVTKHVHANPVVIDADDLLSQPDLVMKKYCEAMGIPHEPTMTSWEPGMIDEWKFWPQAWFSTLVKSTGFIKRDATKHENQCKENFPQEVTKAIEDARPYYEFLRTKRITID